MKRFTETTKWRDPWFRKLSIRAKSLFLWLADNCDNSGVVYPDLEAASFDIGETVKEQHIAELESRLKRLPNGKVWLRKFIPFQYGNLSVKCIPHLRVIESLQAHGISYPENPDLSTTLVPTLVATLVGGVGTTLEEKDKDKDKDKDKGTEGVQGEKYHPHARTALHALNLESGRQFRETDPNLTIITARLKEPGVSIEGVMQMIKRQCDMWKPDPKMCEFLRPETLFGKTKFDGYYAAKDVPITNHQTKRPESGQIQELIDVKSL